MSEQSQAQLAVPTSGEASERRMLDRFGRIAIARPALTVFLLALVLRAAVAIGAYAFFDGAVFGDDATYRMLAEDVLSGASAQWDPYTRSLYEGTAAFSLPLTLVLGFTGGVALAGSLLVAVAGAGAAALTCILARHVLSVRWAMLAGLIVAFLPSQVLWSSLTLKDAFVWAALAAIACALARANKGARLKGWIPWLAAATVSLGALAFLRPHTTVIAAWAMALAAWLGEPTQRLRRGSAALGVAIFLPLLVGFGPAGADVARQAGSLEHRRFFNALDAASAIIDPNDLIQKRRATLAAEQRRAWELAETYRREAQEERQRLAQLARDYDLALLQQQSRPEDSQPSGDSQSSGHSRERIERVRRDVVEGERRVEALLAQASEYEEQAEYASEVLRTAPDRAIVPESEGLSADLRHLPRGMSVMLLQPYPFTSAPGLDMRLAAVESGLLWYPLLVLALLGLPLTRSRRSALAFPVLAGAGVLVAYALAEGNLGTAYRHRGEFVWVVAVLAAMGAARLWASWRKV